MKKIFLFLILFCSVTYADNHYGLKTGGVAPSFSAKDIDGKTFDLNAELKTGSVILVFYRGGWCPYCNLQLRDVQTNLLPETAKYKAQIVAISVDKPDEGLLSKGKNELGFRVLTDQDAKIIKLYNLAFTVPKDLVKKYKNEYKIDLEKSSGRKHHVIAVPAVVVIGTKGKIEYFYANEDYKVRAKNEDVINALKTAN